MSPTRTLLRWHGGKWLLAPWIISHFPPHRIYVEPYGGAASVLLRKPRCYAEVYNDLDGEVVNLFRVLRNPTTAAILKEEIRLTPFARDEFFATYEKASEPIEAARQLVVRSFMGFGSNAHNTDIATGFRSNSSRSGTTPAKDWRNYPDALGDIIERLRGVVIENKPALEIVPTHDSEETLIYLDPPYVHETRSMKLRKDGSKYHRYSHEMGAEDHVAMIGAALGWKGMVAISGYRNPNYDRMLAGWTRLDKATHADGARDRIECLWLSPSLIAARRNYQPSLEDQGMPV